MTMEKLKNDLPDNAKDIKLNLAIILTEEGAPDLSQHQRYGIALASAYATKNHKVITALLDEVTPVLSINEMAAAQSAAIIMAMNNIYYRFTHLVNDASYLSMPAKLRMSVIGNSGINKIDFELNCLAVSAMNGCGKCIEAHAQELTKSGVSKLAIQSAVRIASVLNAAALGVEIQSIC